MAVIRVNPASIVQYASFATQQFERIRLDLQLLTQDAVTVRYFGPNAVGFKTEIGQIAVDFSRALLKDLGQIAEAVSLATSNIAHALGGAPVRIAVNGSPVAMPAVDAGDGAVDIDTAALEELKPSVARRLGTVDAALQEHLVRLEATDWQGQAKLGAVEAVGRFTAAARARTQETRASVARSIDQQIQSVLAADR